LHIPPNTVFSAIMREQYDKKRQRRKSIHSKRPIFGIVINEKAKSFDDDKIDFLVGELARSRSNWHIIKSTVEKEAAYQIRKLLPRQPAAPHLHPRNFAAREI